MKTKTAGRAIAYGAISGMRSMAGPTALGMSLRERHARTRAGRIMSGGAVKRLLPVLAAGEMLADKLPFIPSRTDTLPLAGRALMGGIAGAVIASEERSSVWAGALIGAATAVAVAHLAYRLRKLADEHVPDALSAVVEDGLVFGLSAAVR